MKKLIILISFLLFIISLPAVAQTNTNYDYTGLGTVEITNWSYVIPRWITGFGFFLGLAMLVFGKITQNSYKRQLTQLEVAFQKIQNPTSDDKAEFESIRKKIKLYKIFSVIGPILMVIMGILWLAIDFVCSDCSGRPEPPEY